MKRKVLSDQVRRQSNIAAWLRVLFVLVAIAAVAVPPTAQVALAGVPDAPLVTFRELGSCADVNGKGIVAAGVGLDAGFPANITINVPGTVLEAYLYWNGADPSDTANDSHLIFNDGSTDHNVTGTQIGGPAYWEQASPYQNARFSYAYRADVSSWVMSGNHTYTVKQDNLGPGGTPIDELSEYYNGAELVVIYESLSLPPQRVKLMENMDLAHGHSRPASGPDTVPVAFSFDKASVPRTLNLLSFLGGAGVYPSSNGTAIWYDMGTGPEPVYHVGDNLYSKTKLVDDPFNANAGNYWDSYGYTINVPAGTEWVAVQLESKDVNGAQIEWVGQTFQIELACPKVKVTKTLVQPSDGIAVEGEAVQFKIEVENIGNTTLEVVPLEDTYDTTYLTYVNANPASDDNNDDGQINWSDLTTSFGSDLAPGQKFTVYVNFTAKYTTEALPGDVTENLATVSGAEDENQNVAPDDSDSAMVEITHPELTVTKTLVEPTNGVAVVGEQVHYQIQVTNSGDTTITYLPLDDNFDTAHLDFMSANPSESSHNEAAGTIHWNDLTVSFGSNLAPGQTFTIDVYFTATASSTPNHVINTAIVSGATDENGDDVPDDQDSDDTLIITQPGLEVTKTLVLPTDGIAVEGEQVKFKIEVLNTGDTTISVLPLRDTYDTTYLTYVNANPASDDNNDDGQIDWSDLTVSFGSDLAPGQKFTVYVFFTAKHTTESLPGDVTTNYATTHDVVDENGDSVPDDDGSADVEITHPEVQVTKTLVDPANGVAAVGDPVQYRIDIYNSGDTRIDVLPLDDNFDTAHLDFVSATPAESSHSEPAGTIHWNDITAALGNLNPGQTHTIYVNFVAMASSKPDHVNNTAIVSGATDENGDDVPDDQDSDDTLIVTAPGLEVTKTLVSPTSGQVLVGDPVQFKIEIENTGNTTIVLLPLQDTYNTNCLSYVGATPQSDDNNDDGQINWSDLTAAAPYGFGSDLAPGQKFTVYVNFTAAGACNPATNLGSVINAVDENGDLLSDSDDATVVVVAPASIGDYVWYDDNDNGVQDEPAGNGINGVTVDLYWDSDNNGSYETHVGQQTTANYPSTGNPGWYDFTHLWPGDYRVDVTDVNGVLATYRLTTPPEPLDVSVSAGEDYNDADFGYVQDFHDWDYDCQENTIVDVIGDGMMNNNPQTVVIPDPGNVTRMIVQVVVKKSHGYPYPDLVQVTTPLQNFSLTYPTSMSSGSYLYELEVTPTTQVTAQVSGIHGDSKPKALVVYVFRTTTMPQISVGHTLNEFVYHSSHVEVINIPPLDATSDVTVTVAIADNEDDPRPLTVKAEAGGVVEQITFQTPNMGDELDIRSVVLPNVPMGTSVVTVTEISPYPSPDGDSSIWTGVDVDTYCASCSIGDRVWDDVNANGAQDDGATGIQNVDIKLYRDDGDGSFNPSVDYYIGQQTTMGDGFYDFLNLAPGTYHVDVQDGTVPAGYTLTTPPEPRTVALPPNTDYNDADFGYYQPGRIGDYVWNDINGNGLQDEGAGYGLNNVLVNLWQDENNNDVIDGPDVKWQTTTTSGDGWYEFAHLPPDNYIVEIDGSNFNAGGALDGYYFIPGSESGPEPYPYDLAPAEVHLDADFGYAGKGTISGIVWYDWDEDGVQDLGEDGIPGVDVCLYYDDGTIPGQLDPNDTPTGLCDTTNSPDGDYAFPDVLPGEYLVVESQPSGYESTTPDVIPVTLIVVGPSGNAPDKNFGEVKYASLGNYAWVDSICSPTCGTLDPGEWSDLNHNGEQDPGEPGGIPNVQMTVDGVDVLGRPVHIITYTDSNGYYLVDHLVPGTYTVTVATPSGYVRTSPSPLVTTLGPGDEDLDIDFGFISPTAVDLQEFTAEAGDGAIVLRWRTLVETNNIGFHVWRATHYKGPYQRITTKPVPSSASDGVGAEYLYTDTNVKRGVTYWYKLETVPDGQIFGPVSITWDDPGPGGFRVFVPFISR